jgi:hypothetical protein
MFRNKKRWLRFSLATFMAAFTVLSLWLGWQTYRARQQQNAVANLVAIGGIIQYPDDVAKANARRGSRGAPPPDEPSHLARIQAAIGRDFFDGPVRANFAANFGRRPNSDEPTVTPDVLARLSTLTTLETLGLSFSGSVTDDQLIHLSGLTNLQLLYLDNNAVRGPGLAHLTRLPKLNHIDLSYSPLDDEGLRWVSEIKSLNSLGLSYTGISDAGVAHLVKLPSLKDLQLRGTAVTDEGLTNLAKCSQLTTLYLQKTSTTSAGVAWIKKQLPNCVVEASFGLGQSPVDVDWFPDDVQPKVDELNARLRQLQISGTASSNSTAPNGPVNKLHINSCTVSDAALLRLIAKLPALKDLRISRGLAGDGLLQGLSAFTGLEFLGLAGTQITDAGLEHVSKLPKLRGLELGWTAVTDNGINAIAQLKELEWVYLGATGVTVAGARALQKALPECQIDF